MDPDLNKYDLNHAVTAHPRMPLAEWQQTYHQAWETYYTDQHIETVLKRAMATGTSPGKAVLFISWFKGCIGIEKIHPLEGGFLRLKFRRDRRPGLSIEPAWLFYPGYLAETLGKQIRWISLYTRLHRMYRRIKRDPLREEYMDLALTPVSDDETETREMFQSEAAQAFVVQVQRVERMRRGEAA
jgi:hypothetical protein